MSTTNQSYKKQKSRIDGRGSKSTSKQLSRETNSTVSWKPSSERDPDEDIDESEQCIICASRIHYAAISPCNHTTCHTCTFRQRALYKKNVCLICRTENERVIITGDIQKQYADFKQADFRVLNDEYGIDFTSGIAAKSTLSLLDMICPVKQCVLHKEHIIFKNFKLLNEHAKSEHDRYFCEICAFNKKAFISELKLYQYRDLQRHKSKGDEKGFNGHPLCRFCNGKRFYSDDELFVHLREVHEKCHVCDQIDSSNPQYFKNYDALSEHFREQHYICTVQSCLDQKFVVFMDEFDLKAHLIKEHKNIFGGDKNLLSFGNIGYNNPKSNSFNSQLSTFPQSGTISNNGTRRNISKSGKLNRLNLKNGSEEDDLEVDSLELKRMRLEERARHYLNYDSSAVENFKKINKNYEDYKIDASELLRNYQTIFSDLQAEDIGILIYELSQLFRLNSDRGKLLLEINEEMNSSNSRDEQFPLLAGSAQTPSFIRGSWSSSNTSTKTSSRVRNEQDFPSLPTPEPAPKLQHKVISYKKTILSTTSLALKQKPVINRSTSDIKNFKLSYLSGSSSSLKSNSKPLSLNEAAFPALPKVVIKKPPRVNPIVAPSSGVWGGSSSNAGSDNGSPMLSSNSSALDLSNLNDVLPNSNGKKKKKKQVLYHVGI